MRRDWGAWKQDVGGVGVASQLKDKTRVISNAGGKARRDSNRRDTGQ